MSRNASPDIRPAITYAQLLGRVVEHHRRQIGLHQAAIANALSVTQSAYSRLEQGDSAMSVNHLRVIAQALRTTPAKLLSDTDNYAAALRAKGVDIRDGRKEDFPVGAILLALGLLAALFAARG